MKKQIIRIFRWIWMIIKIIREVYRRKDLNLVEMRLGEIQPKILVWIKNIKKIIILKKKKMKINSE